MSDGTGTALCGGDVVSYVSDRQDRWARECTAFVRESGAVVDTFWHDYERGGDCTHHLSSAELATAEVRFNVNDFDEADRYCPWEDYAPGDRGVITSQHGLQRRLFVRKGAQPDLATKIANARQELEEAESKLSSAEWGLRMRREDLAKLEALRDACLYFGHDRDRGAVRAGAGMAQRLVRLRRPDAPWPASRTGFDLRG